MSRRIFLQELSSPRKEPEARGVNSPLLEIGFQTLLKGVKEGRSPSYHLVPFPSGEGDTGDRASTDKQVVELVRDAAVSPVI